MSRSGRPWLRSRLIVDRGLQFNLVTRMVIFVLFVFCMICAVLFSPLVRRLTGGQDPESRALADVLLYMQERLWPAALICLVVAVIGAAITSHRIAGPLVRVKRIMRFITECHLPNPLQTRPGDYFKNEVEVLNEMVAGLSTRVYELKAASTELNDALSEHGSTASKTFDTEASESFAHVLERAEALQRLLDEFTVQRDLDPEALPESPAAVELATVIPPAARV